MTESREQINEALDLAAKGAIEEACERLWPLVRETEGREEALFSMACCFERAGQLPPAGYLFGWVAERYPDFAPAQERLERCKRLMAERGLHEDFSDSGHASCGSCTLRYRAELPACPYCGGPAAIAAVTPGPIAGGPGPADDVMSDIGKGLDRAWKLVQGRFDEFAGREDLTGAARRVQELAREAKARAHAIAESERAREATKTLGELGSGAAKRVREFAQREEVQRVARQTKQLGEEAIARVRELTSREDASDTGERIDGQGRDAGDRVETAAKHDQLRTTWSKIYKVAEGIVANLQQRIDNITGRKHEPGPNDAGANEIDEPPR